VSAALTPILANPRLKTDVENARLKGSRFSPRLSRIPLAGGKQREGPMLKIFVVLLTTFVLQPSVLAADKIRIGLPADAGHFTFPLAQKGGFLKEEGIEAEIITISGPVANLTLTRGDIDYYTGFGSSMRAMLQGLLPGRVVVCYRPSPHHFLLGRPELKSVKDVKGKNIQVPPGSARDSMARLIIKHFGLDPDKDVKFVAGGGSEAALARMKQGLIDATALPVPWDYHGKKMGFTVLARSEDLFTYPISGLVTHTKKIKEKPDEIKRLIKAEIKANRYMRENRDGTIPVLMGTYKLDKEVATALYDSFVKGFNDDGNLPEDGFRRLIEDTKSVTKIDREVAFSEVSDLSILREAQKELGMKGK
jgi:NitT/TauT family transport system substrate-binding protein